MPYILLSVAFLSLSVLFRLASVLGLTIPLLYALLAPTLFHRWFTANPVLAEGLGWALLGLTALSWVIQLTRKLCAFIRCKREDKIARELFYYRLRQAKARGEDTVSTEGLWR